MSDHRNAQLLRILGMIRDLSMTQCGVAIQNLRDRYGVTRRTVERDLAAIEAAGYAVETVAVPESRGLRKHIPTGSNRGGPIRLDSLAAELSYSPVHDHAASALEAKAEETGRDGF